MKIVDKDERGCESGIAQQVSLKYDKLVKKTSDNNDDPIYEKTKEMDMDFFSDYPITRRDINEPCRKD